jgi:hypothetical protein
MASLGRVIGLPVHPLMGTEWTVRTVTEEWRVAPSLMAHSSARAEWADPSIPTVIPGIVCLLLADVIMRSR